jgi:hypothetical protein
MIITVIIAVASSAWPSSSTPDVDEPEAVAGRD